MTAIVTPSPSVVTLPEPTTPERCWTYIPPPAREATAADVVRQALDALPEMPWAVARYLRNRDYIGRRRQAENCPIYHYLATALYRGGFDTGRLRVGRWRVRGGDTRVPLPEGVRSFVREFDRGWYPLLVGGP